MNFAIVRKAILANLYNSHQIWHALEVIGGEISVTSRIYLRQSLVDLRTKSFLAIPVLGQLPESKGQLDSLGGNAKKKITR